jgi:hypothetical protein
LQSYDSAQRPSPSTTIFRQQYSVKRPYFDTLFSENSVFSKIFFGKPPSKFSARALKKLLSAGVEVTSTLPNSDTQKDLLM